MVGFSTQAHFTIKHNFQTICCSGFQEHACIFAEAPPVLRDFLQSQTLPQLKVCACDGHGLKKTKSVGQGIGLWVHTPEQYRALYQTKSYPFPSLKHPEATIQISVLVYSFHPLQPFLAPINLPLELNPLSTAQSAIPY